MKKRSSHTARPDSARHRLSLRPGPLLFDPRILEKSAAGRVVTGDRQDPPHTGGRLGFLPGSWR